MRIKNRLSPYPVLDNYGDDYVDSSFEVDYEVDTQFTEVYGKLTFKLVNEEIRRLIAEKKAVYAVHIESPTTCYRKVISSDDVEIEFKLNASQVSKVIEIRTFIVLTQAIKGFYSKNFHPDYQGQTFDLEQHQIIAIGTAKNYDVKKDDRLIFMNKVYLDLVNKANKIALLGPYINSVEFENTRLDIVKYYSNFMPVYNDIDILKENEKWKDKINLVDNQLIYFRTPKSIYNSIDELLSNIPENEYYKNIYKDEIKFLEETIGEEWYVVDLLKRGIGIHHGKTPMFLRKFYENEYNIGNMKILLCTNTLMEGINTPTESLLIVDNPGDAFKLNNLMGRVGRLNPSKPKIGKIVLCDRSILSYMKDNNSWLDLKIRAEDVEIFSDDEVLYLNKRYLEKSKQEEYNNKIRKLKENYNISTEDMIERNLELNKTLNLFEKNIYNEIINSKNLYECVVATVKLIPSVSYFFNKTQYENLNLNIDFLPYKTYIVDILVNKSFKDIIKNFNIKYNTTRNIENINIFIDALYNLNNYIKFKFSKIINYLEVVKKEISNENVKKFISLISSFNNSEVSYKILDDLGIETNDAQKIIKVLNISNDISASSMMNILKENKIKLLKENLSPFSKNNIESI